MNRRASGLTLGDISGVQRRTTRRIVSNSSLIGVASSSQEDAQSTDRVVTRGTPVRVNGYSLTTNVSSTNELPLAYNFPITLDRVTFKPVESNIDDIFTLSLQSRESVGSVSMRVVPSSTGQIITFNSSVDIEVGWQIVISRGNVSATLGDISSIEYTGTGNNRQVTLVVVRDPSAPIPAIFQVEGVNQISYSVPLMDNIIIVDTDPIIYEATRFGTIVNTNQRLLLTYTNNSSTDTKRIVLYLRYRV